MIVTLDMIGSQEKLISSFVPPKGRPSHTSCCQRFFCEYFNVTWHEHRIRELNIEWATEALGAGNLLTFCVNATPLLKYMGERFGTRDVAPLDWGGSSLREVVAMIKPFATALPTAEAISAKYDMNWHITLPPIIKIGGRDFKSKTREMFNDLFSYIGRGHVPFQFMLLGHLVFYPNVVKGTPAFMPRDNAEAANIEFGRRMANRINEIAIVAVGLYDEAAFYQNLWPASRCRYCSTRSVCDDCTVRWTEMNNLTFRDKTMPFLQSTLHSRVWDTFLVR